MRLLRLCAQLLAVSALLAPNGFRTLLCVCPDSLVAAGCCTPCCADEDRSPAGPAIVTACDGCLQIQTPAQDVAQVGKSTSSDASDVLLAWAASPAPILVPWPGAGDTRVLGARSPSPPALRRAIPLRI